MVWTGTAVDQCQNEVASVRYSTDATNGTIIAFNTGGDNSWYHNAIKNNELQCAAPPVIMRGFWALCAIIGRKRCGEK